MGVLLTFVLIAASFAMASPSNAASDTKGADFWLAFPGNFGGPELTLFISGDTATTGNVSIAGLAFSSNFTVTPGVVTSVALPSNTQIESSDTVENLGIHVTANAEISVYGLNRVQFTTDAYLGLPTDILGTSYVVLGWGNVDIVNATEFAVVASQNATTVTIRPTVTTDGHTAGVPYNVTLDQGQTYQLRNGDAAPADLSGTIVTSTKPIGVFGGHQCANIPDGGTVACDHVVEQLPPTQTWGKSFVTMPLATRLRGDTFRIIASDSATTVKINGATVATLGAGQFTQQLVTGPSTITSDKPVLVAQYSNGSSFDGVTSDPFMMLIPPYEQFLNSYTVTTPATGFTSNFINIVVPNGAVGSVKLDGVNVPAGSYTAIPGSTFSGAQLPVELGAHTLAGPLPFGSFMYGFADYDSYGYPGGFSASPVASATKLVLAPKTASHQVNTNQCVTGTVTDQNGAGLADIRVDFAVSGANTTAGFANTNGTGVAQFCYTGTNTGTDSILGSVGTLSDTAAKTWTSIPVKPPPVVDAGPDVTGAPGAAITLNGSFSDPNAEPPCTSSACGDSSSWSVSDPACTIVAGPREYGADATVKTPATITCTTPGVYTATLTVSDGKNGPVSDSAKVTITSPSDRTPPECKLLTVSSTGITVLGADRGSGLAAVQIDRTKNATVTVPPFTPGTTKDVVIKADKIKVGTASSVQLTMIDVAGNKTVCDPVTATIAAGATRTFNGVPQAEHLLSVSEAAGVAAVAVEVNGTTRVIWAPDGRTVDLGDLGSGTVTIRVLGAPGTSAAVMLWDGK